MLNEYKRFFFFSKFPPEFGATPSDNSRESSLTFTLSCGTNTHERCLPWVLLLFDDRKLHTHTHARQATDVDTRTRKAGNRLAHARTHTNSRTPPGDRLQAPPAANVLPSKTDRISRRRTNERGPTALAWTPECPRTRVDPKRRMQRNVKKRGPCTSASTLRCST